MNFIDKMKDIAKGNKKTIVLPEVSDIRTIDATQSILSEGIANVILIGKKEDMPEDSQKFNIDGAIWIDPKNYNKFDEMVDTFVELRKAKGMTKDEAIKILSEQPLFFAVMLVKVGVADGMVAGAANTTANVLRPALQILKMREGSKIVSAAMIMATKAKDLGADGVFAFADCGLNQNPTAEQLAYIGLDTASTFEALIGAEAKVAMLSHSSLGSAKHADVDKVVEATKLAKEIAPDVKLDGELQLDAAIIPETGKQKAPTSPVAGSANVLVFPDLDAGNIGYKLVQRLGDAEAYGPICQGIAKPVNDLSRGCSAEDIVGVTAITAVQAIMAK